MSSTSPTQAGPASNIGASTSAGGGGEVGQEANSTSGDKDKEAVERLVCGVDGCTKTFGKQSHLTRHRKTHGDVLWYKCRDVCTRHEATIHKSELIFDDSHHNEERHPTSPPAKKRARSGSTLSSQATPSPAPLPAVSLAPPVFPPLPQAQQQPQPPPPAAAQFPFPLPAVHPPAAQINRPPSPLWQPQWSLQSEKTSAALSNMAPFDFFPPSTEAADVSSSFDASLGWGYNATELDLLDIFGSAGQGGTAGTVPQDSRSGHVTPAIDWLKLLGGVEGDGSAGAAGGAGEAGDGTAGTSGGGGAAPLPAAINGASQQPLDGSAPNPAAQATSPAVAALASVEAESLQTPSDGGGPEAPSRSAWPHIYEPVAGSADPLSLPSVAAPPPLLLFEQLGGAVSSEMREAMMQFVSDSHRSPWWAVSLASFPSATILSACVGLYISRFHDSLPILDPADITAGNASPILLLSCAAVGAMYRPDFEGLGVALTEVVRRTALWKREQDPRSFFEVTVIQAWLLSSISGLFCGSRKLYQHAEIARAGLATAARRMNLLRESTSFVQDLLARKTPSEDELRAAQKEDELRLRLGWGIYIFDMLVSVLLNLQPVVSIAEVAESTNLPEETVLPSGAERWPFRRSLALLLTEGRLDGFLPPLATTVLQLTLYRLCLDASYSDSVLSSVLDVQRSGTYRLVFPPDFKQNSQELLDRIGVAWHSSTSAITPLHVQTTALAYHATIQFSCPDFLSLCKICAGKYGSERAESARQAVVKLATTHPVSVRRVLVRAVQLSALLERYRYDTPTEAIWIADAAMALWAIVKFARTALSAPPAPLPLRSTVHWSDSRSIEPWVQHGGPLALKNGLGDFDTVTPEAVLIKFAERLEDLPWGLAKKYRVVLLQLCIPEE
ncbi:hypothetical protein JCM8547_003887 [Rhodosporidiobolus lusitaniae]